MKQNKPRETETKWTRMICASLERMSSHNDSNIPLVITPFTPSRYSQHAIPDRYFTSNVWRGWVEFKGIKTEVTPLQKRFAKQQNLVVPYSCFVWRQVDDSLLVKLEYICKTYDCSVSLGYGDCLSVLEAMGDLYNGNRTRLDTERYAIPHTP